MIKDTEPILYEETDMELAEKLDPILTDPRLSPLMAKEFSNLPPTYIMTGNYDVLRDDGLLYAEHLKKAGVTVRSNFVKAAYHGIFWRLYLQDSLVIYDDCIEFITKYL